MSNDDVSSSAFFIIDSENIDLVKPRLYGYGVSNNKIITHLDNDTESFVEGSFIRIDCRNEKIIITQDYLGSIGLYLYHNEDYFAISNSIMHLAHHLSGAHTLSINKPYAICFIETDLCSYSVYDTIFNEITLLDRWSIVEIDKQTKKINYHLNTNYRENSIPISSVQALKILDQWHDKWSSFIYNAHEKTTLSTDLSGGFDSRMVLSLFLNDSTDMNKINVHSINQDIHCFSEDYEIAQLISKKYNFNLNTNNNDDTTDIYSVADLFNIYLLSKLTEHKIPYTSNKKYNGLHYKFSGEGGECIRGYWKNLTPDQFIKKQVKRFRNYPLSKRAVLEPIVIEFIKKQYNAIKQKYSELSQILGASDYNYVLYKESRARHHYGKAMQERYYNNIITIAPCFDPMINQISGDFLDLPALIFKRYVPPLFSLKFEGGRSFSKSQIEKICKINNMAEYRTRSFQKTPFSLAFEPELITFPKQLFELQDKDINLMNRGIFEDRVKKLFTYSFYEELYDSVVKHLHSKNDFPIQYTNTIIAIALVNKYAIDGDRKILSAKTKDKTKKFSDIIERMELALLSDEVTDELQPYLSNPYVKYIKANVLIQKNGKTHRGEVYDLLNSAYDAGIQDASYTLFDYLLQFKDPYSYIEMKILLSKMKKDDSIDSIVRLARAYKNGSGVAKNLQTSIEYYKKAAKINESWVKNELFDALWEVNTPETDKEAITLIQKYVSLNDQSALRRLEKIKKTNRL